MHSSIKGLWGCGDTELIEFVMNRARLNHNEKEVIILIMDECLTQEKAAEKLDISARSLQERWVSACNKIDKIPWVKKISS